MSRARELDTLNPNVANKALNAIAKKQNGRCRQCSEIIKAIEGIVSNGGNYYHRDCAEKLYII